MTCWVTVGDTLSNDKALFDTLADTLPEMEEYSVFDKRIGPQAPVDAMAETLAEVEAVTPGDPLGDAQALNDLLSYTWRDIGRCAATCRHAG